jgi:hypothetical protein
MIKFLLLLICIALSWKFFLAVGLLFAGAIV